MLYWEKVLYPPFLDTIRGEYYTVVSDQNLRIELYNLARRAIAAFKFPKISLAYDADFTIVNHEGTETVTAADDWNDVNPYFTNDSVSYNEIEIILAWMKVYWAENQISDADNFLDIYTDSNIKTFSRANALDKYIKFATSAKAQAKELENRYSRVTGSGTPALGEINEDD